MYRFQSFSDLESALQEKKITLPNLVENYISNINQRKNLNAFLEVYESEAKEQAFAIQEKIDRGIAGKLAGMVLGIKDNISYKNHLNTAGSKILEHYQAPFSATAIQNLLKEDAIIIGRLNCDEFGMGSSNENSAFGPCLNPLDETKVPGGSSGGSAAAVAGDLCFAALGSDTGGSVRQPAAFCGLVGMKPTYGQVSRHGLVAYASSFDQIGPITRSAADTWLLFEIMNSDCEFDATAFPVRLNSKTDTFKLAIIEESFSENVQQEIKEGILQLEQKLIRDGHEVQRVSFPLMSYIVPAYYVLTMAEASSNLSRYDGVQYGGRSFKSQDLIQMTKQSRTDGFGQEVKRRIMMGNFVLSQEYSSAYYKKAQKIRRMIKNETEVLLNNFDFIVTPTTTTTAFDLEAKQNDPLAMYLMDIFTVQANLTGLPAISLPLYEDDQKLPIGIQFLSEAYSEQKLIQLSKYLYR